MMGDEPATPAEPAPPAAGWHTAQVRCNRCGAAVEITAHPDGDALRWRWFCHVNAGVGAVDCTPCRERGQALRDARKAAWAETVRREAQRARIASSQIPPMWLDMDMDRLGSPQLGQEDGFAAAERWAEGFGLGVLLHGPVGRGKTHIAAYAIRKWLAAERGVRWFNVADLSLILAHEPFDSPRYRAALSATSPPDEPTALVLDDLDKIARPDARALNPLYVLLNRWTEARYPVFATSNADEDGIARVFGQSVAGQAIVSRLVGHCVPIAVSGPDRRRRTAVSV